MLPYRPPEVKQPKVAKLKPIPSVQLISALTTVCQNTPNSYDRKKHVLTVTDFQSFQLNLAQKLGRSAHSFEKQLRMLGFGSKKYKELVRSYDGQMNGQPKFVQARVYKWKGKKEQLINQELSFFQSNLQERKEDTLAARKKIRNNREILDSQIESIIFSMMVNPQSSKVADCLDSVISDIREKVNQTQLIVRQILSKTQSTLGNQLQLYRLLIYKQEFQTKKTNIQQSNEQQQGYEDNSQNFMSQSHGQESPQIKGQYSYNSQIQEPKASKSQNLKVESPHSQISIQMQNGQEGSANADSSKKQQRSK